MPIETRLIPAEDYEKHAERLAEILKDCVEGGASVNFLLPFPIEDAKRYWQKREAGLNAGEVLLFGAFVDGKLQGTVQLVLAQQPNQPFRAEISKMLVHREARRKGLGRALLEAAEAEALRRNRTLLLLDTAKGSDGERLYRSCGWQPFGVVEGYAYTVHGVPEAAVFFSKVLA
jgi:GNAT superfamily N-acetyltransferase